MTEPLDPPPLPAIRQPITDGSMCLRHDGYDAQVVAEAFALYSRLPALAADSGLATAEALLSDLFLSFHAHVPQLDPVVPLRPSHAVNRLILEQVMGTVAWAETRAAGTVGDMLASALATAGVGASAMAGLDDATRSRVQALAEAERQTAALFAEAEALDDLAAQAAGSRADELAERARALRESAEQQAADVAQLAQELEAQAEQVADATRRAARGALQQAQAQLDGLQQAIAAYGGAGAGPGGLAQPLTASDALALAQRVGKSRLLQEVAALCGRLTRIALRVQASKVQHPPDEVTSVGFGRDLSRVLPNELGRLTDPALEDLFWLAFAEGRLMQYELIGNERQGRGPIVLALDSSGSMRETAGQAGVTKEVWAKAVALALLAIARQQRRDMAVLHFSDDGDLAAFRFPKGQATVSEVLACTEHFFGGGTAFAPWMARALALVDEATYDKADVICVSDGLTSIPAEASEAWQERRRQRGMRVTSVLIGAQDGAGTLAAISDAVLELARLEDDLPVLEQVFGV